MEMRQNVYFIILYAVILGFVLLSATLLYARINEMSTDLSHYRDVRELLDKGVESYLSGNYFIMEPSSLSDSKCYSKYIGRGRVQIFCDGKPIDFLYSSIPVYVYINSKAESPKKIFIERGALDYGVFKYLYVIAVTPRIVFFRVGGLDISDERVENILLSYISFLPNSYIIGFYDEDSYVILCVKDSVSECTKTDFMVMYGSSDEESPSIEKLIEKINEHVGSEGAISFDDGVNEDIIDTLRIRFSSLDPVFVSFVDSKSKCTQGENCIELRISERKIFYNWKNPNDEFLSYEVSSLFETFILTFFKHHYGYEDRGFMDILEDIYMGTFLDYVSVYTPVVAERYKILGEKMVYEYESYEECKDWFNDVTSLLCGDETSVCKVSASEGNRWYLVGEVMSKLGDVKDISGLIFARGCEERIYL